MLLKRKYQLLPIVNSSYPQRLSSRAETREDTKTLLFVLSPGTLLPCLACFRIGCSCALPNCSCPLTYLHVARPPDPSTTDSFRQEALLFERYETTAGMHSDCPRERLIHVLMRIQLQGVPSSSEPARGSFWAFRTTPGSIPFPNCQGI